MRKQVSNREWNTRLISTEQGEVAKEIVAEFNELWNSKYALSFDDFYENYKERYKIIKHQREIAKQEEITSIEKYKLQPNSMQVGFITNLKKILAAGEDRALLISATGTGKTYASAFAMRELRFKRVLFFESEFGKKILADLGIEGNYEGIGHCAIGYAAAPANAPAPRKDNYVYYVR